MNRRDVLGLAAGAAVAAPLMARAQQRPSRRIAVLPIKYALMAARIAAFEEGLRVLGWTNGSNLHIEYRPVEADRERMRSAAGEIVALAPELILSQSTPMTAELLRLTRTIPIVFVHVSDPIGSGFVKSSAEPGGTATGFTDIEASLGSKWLQLLKEVAPAVSRAALLFNPDTAPARGEFFLGPFTVAGGSLGVTTLQAPVHDVHEIETTFAKLGAEPGGGVVVTAESFTGSHSAEIVALAARFRLPAVYPARQIVANGGLVAYGIDSPDLYRRAAPYVDRILKGAKPADLPVQQPTKFELVINLTTAKALGLTVPRSLLARADEVIE